MAYYMPIPVARSIILSATKYLILQLLSSANFFMYGNRYAVTLASGSRCANYTQLSMPCILTVS